MDYKDIKKLIDDMGNSNLDSLEIEFPEGIKISMTKNSNKVVASTGMQNQVIEASAPMTVPTVQENKETSLVNVQQKEENFRGQAKSEEERRREIREEMLRKLQDK